MSYLLHILVALFALMVPEYGWGTGAELPWLLPALCVVPYALAWRVRNRLLHGRYRAAAMTDRMLEWSPVLLQVVAVGGVGWTRSVESWWGIETSLTQWPGPGLLLGIVPYVVLQLLAIDARVRSSDPRADRRRELRAFQSRLFLSALLPFVLFLGVSSLVSLDETWQVRIEEVALYNTLFLAVILGCFVLVVPHLLEKTWETTPLERGWIRSLLEEVARKAEFRCRKLLVWKTGGTMANAAIVGFTPRSRVVLFSDALLAQLGPRELAAVFAHEIGHARGRHPVIFAGFALILFLGSDLLLIHLPLESEALGIGLFLGLFALWLVAFGFVSRRFELEADLVGIELLGDGQPLLDALEQVGGSAASRKNSWRHFGMTRRQAFLERAARDPGTGRKLRRTLRWWKLVGSVVLLAIVILQAVTILRSFATDQVIADLRLGRFVPAAERIARGTEVEEQIARLVERGASLGTGEWSPAGLEEQARHAFVAGDLSAGRELLDLAVLRGHRELDEVVEAVHVRSGADEDTPPRALTSEELAALPAPWAALLGPAAAGDPD